MSSDRIRLRYDGPALVNHSIDIDDLAPALLAVGNLCKLTNKKFNGDSASVRVVVNADLEQNCFELYLELILTFSEQIKLLINNDIVSAKEILKWIGIIGGGLATDSASPLGLFHFLKILGGRKIEKSKLVVKNGKDVTQINIEGDNNRIYYIYPETEELLKDERIINNVRKVVAPLTKQGYEKLEFETENEKEEITKDDAKEILDIDTSNLLNLPENEAPQTITAWIKVYAPVYKTDIQNWRFIYGDKHETIDISETDIAENAMKRGGALANDAYKVKLEITQLQDKEGNFKNKYKIKEVLEVHEAKLTSQNGLFNED